MKGLFFGKKFSRSVTDNKGFSLVEAILALALAAILFSQIFSVIFSIQNGSIDSSLRTDAIILAKNNLKDFGQIISRNFNATSSDFHLAPFLGGVKVFDITQCRKEVKSIVRWNSDLSTNAKEVYFSEIFTSPSILKKLGNDCGGNDFLNQISTTTFSMESGSVPSTLNITGLDVFDHYAFASAISDTPEEIDLIITNLNEFPVFTSSISSLSGINSLDVTNNYVFAAHNSTSSQLVLIDIQNKNSPQIIASSTLPGVAGTRPEGWSIYYFDSKVYLGTKRTAGHEFHIFDVSNPAEPTWLGSREVNHNINGIVVRDGFAYLATSGNSRDLIVLDVHDPANITQKSTLDLKGNEDGKSLYLIGNKLYLGRFKSLNNSGHHDFYSLDVTNVMQGGSISIINFFDINADVNAVKVVGNYAFLSTSHPTKELIVLDIASSSSATTPKNIDLPSKATDVDYENGTLILSTFDSPGVFKINLKNN